MRGPVKAVRALDKIVGGDWGPQWKGAYTGRQRAELAVKSSRRRV